MKDHLLLFIMQIQIYLLYLTGNIKSIIIKTLILQAVLF